MSLFKTPIIHHHDYKNKKTLTYLAWLVLVFYMFIIASLMGNEKNINLLFNILPFIVIAKSRFAYGISLALATLLAIILSPSMIYGTVNQAHISTILVSGDSNILRFFTELPLKLYLYAGIAIISTCILFRLRTNLIVKKYPCYALITLIAGHIFFYHSSTQEYSFDRAYKTDNFFIDQIHNLCFSYNAAIKEVARQQNVTHAKSDWQPQTHSTEFDDYIVIIGESARRDALHAYGFKIAENTPFLSNTPRIQFNNYTSASGMTQISLIHTFFLNYDKKSNIGNNIVNLANKAGFQTYWISNQYELGMLDNLMSGMGELAYYGIFYGNKNVFYGNPLTRKPTSSTKNDERLIPHIQQSVQETTNKRKIIFIHLFASHFPFCDRTDNKFDTFHINEDLSCYIQSIKQTDKFIEKVHNLLQNNKQETGRKWAMVYFSDHGLAARKGAEEKILHGDQFKENFDVPFVMLNSELTKSTFINAKRSGFNFFDFFAQWTGIKDKLLPNACHFVSEEICKEGNTYIDLQAKKGKYENLPNEATNYLK